MDLRSQSKYWTGGFRSLGYEFTWSCGPPIHMKIGLSLCCMLMARGRHRSDYTLDKVRPFLSLIGNARFEPIYVAPSLRVGKGGST